MDKQTILKESNFFLDEKSGVKFRLEYRNWNDYGFYTLYSLEMRLPDSNLSYRIADIHVMNIGQKAGEKPSTSNSPIIIISDTDSAERLFLFLSPKQRARLENLLAIKYDCLGIEREQAFINSVLRDKTISEFIKQQEVIKNLMHSSVDACSFLLRNKHQLSLWLSEVAK